ncbi:MAG: hypothetical protein R2822_06140 [Spirosomataceae bacterium]
MKNYFYLLLIGTILTIACTNNEKINMTALTQKAAILANGDAAVQMHINHQDFYTSNLPFNTQVRVLPQSFKASLMDSTKGNIELEFIKNDWFKNNPISFSLTNTTLGQPAADQVIFMVGKLVSSAAQIGEGYILTEGKVTLSELSKKRIVIEVEGNLNKPGDATVPENYIPIVGAIVIKNPKFTPDSAEDLLKTLQ